MKKKLSSLLAVILCLAMMLSLSSVALAAEGQGQQQGGQSGQQQGGQGGQQQGGQGGQGGGFGGGAAVVQEILDSYTDEQKQAVELYNQGVNLWNSNIGNDLTSEQAQKNVQAMQCWYDSAEMGYIQAVVQIQNVISKGQGGFVKDAETNENVSIYGRSMGLNIDGESGWSIMRRFGEMAIDFGLDDLNSFGNSTNAQKTIYTNLAEAYGDAEATGVEPWAADYEKSYQYYTTVPDLSYKTWRYVAELFWFGYLDAPEGYTVGEYVLECMLKAVESNDATANFYLGLWYLNDDGTGPDLTIPEGETKYTMAVKYLEAGRSIASHGTIRKTQESLLRLAELYEYGEGIEQDLEKALEVYNVMVSEKFYPTNEDCLNAVARVEAKIAAKKNNQPVVLFNDVVVVSPIANDNGRTFVPYTVCEALGLNAVWDAATQTVTITDDFYTIVITIGSDKATVNHDTLTMHADAKLIDGVAYVPLRFVAETVNLEVSWDGTNKCVMIDTPDGYHPGDDGTIVVNDREVIEFGGYEWYVLERKSDRMLVVMKDVLEERAYNDEYTQVTWETSDMREYLNGEFYNSFNEEDRKQICETLIANPYNGFYKTLAGNSTEDHIFLLSREEVLAYFGELESDASQTWWTRTPGIDQRYNVMVTASGDLNNYGYRVNNPLGGVRPAMWLSDPIPDPHSKPVMQVTAIGSHDLQIYFDRPMTAANGAFTVDKDDEIGVDIAAIKWSEDQCTIVITLVDALEYGSTYKINMKNMMRPNMTNKGQVTIDVSTLLDTISTLINK